MNTKLTITLWALVSSVSWAADDTDDFVQFFKAADIIVRVEKKEQNELRVVDHIKGKPDDVKSLFSEAELSPGEYLVCYFKAGVEVGSESGATIYRHEYTLPVFELDGKKWISWKKNGKRKVLDWVRLESKLKSQIKDVPVGK